MSPTMPRNSLPRSTSANVTTGTNHASPAAFRSTVPEKLTVLPTNSPSGTTSAALALSFTAAAQQPPTVVDLPTRPGVTQRMLVTTPPERLNLTVLAALCDILGTEPSALIMVESASLAAREVVNHTPPPAGQVPRPVRAVIVPDPDPDR